MKPPMLRVPPDLDPVADEEKDEMDAVLSRGLPVDIGESCFAELEAVCATRWAGS